MSVNFMAAVTICSDFGAQKNKVSHCFPIHLPWSDGTGCTFTWREKRSYKLSITIAIKYLPLYLPPQVSPFLTYFPSTPHHSKLIEKVVHTIYTSSIISCSLLSHSNMASSQSTSLKWLWYSRFCRLDLRISSAQWPIFYSYAVLLSSVNDTINELFMEETQESSQIIPTPSPLTPYSINNQFLR